MSKNKNSASRKKGHAGRNALVGIGLFFIITGVFLGAFTCSFHVMISSDAATDEGTLESQNKNLNEEIQLLNDQITILENELERYKNMGENSGSKTTRSSNSSSSSSSGSSSSSSRQTTSDNNIN